VKLRLARVFAAIALFLALLRWVGGFGNPFAADGALILILGCAVASVILATKHLTETWEADRDDEV